MPCMYAAIGVLTLPPVIGLPEESKNSRLRPRPGRRAGSQGGRVAADATRQARPTARHPRRVATPSVATEVRIRFIILISKWFT